MQGKSRWAVSLVAAVASGCNPFDLEKPPPHTFVAVDSGGGTQIQGLQLGSRSTPGLVQSSKMSWSSDGASLVIAGAPSEDFPANESSLWTVDVSSRALTKHLTVIGGGDFFRAVQCYHDTPDCDVVYRSGRVVRRSGNGAMIDVLGTARPSGFIASGNGRFIVYYGGPSDTHLLEVNPRSDLVLGSPAIFPIALTTAVSDDGAELDMVKSGSPATVGRYRSSTGLTFWEVPSEPGWSENRVHELQWVESTPYILVESSSGHDRRFVQYVVGTSTPTVLGTTKSSSPGPPPAMAWRPALARLMLGRLSACDYDAAREDCGNSQWELELFRDGICTRVARSSFAYDNLTLSRDGHHAAYGSGVFFIKDLPE